MRIIVRNLFIVLVFGVFAVSSGEISYAAMMPHSMMGEEEASQSAECPVCETGLHKHIEKMKNDCMVLEDKIQAILEHEEMMYKMEDQAALKTELKKHREMMQNMAEIVDSHKKMTESTFEIIENMCKHTKVKEEGTTHSH